MPRCQGKPTAALHWEIAGGTGKTALGEIAKTAVRVQGRRSPSRQPGVQAGLGPPVRHGRQVVVRLPSVLVRRASLLGEPLRGSGGRQVATYPRACHAAGRARGVHSRNVTGCTLISSHSSAEVKAVLRRRRWLTMFTYLSYSVWTKNVNSRPIPPNGSSLHHRCGRNWGCGNLRGLEVTERLLDRRSGFRRIQVGDPEIAHRCLDVLVTQQVLDGLNLCCA